MDFGFSHIKADSCLKAIVLNINGWVKNNPEICLVLFDNLEFNAQDIDQIES